MKKIALIMLSISISALTVFAEPDFITEAINEIKAESDYGWAWSHVFGSGTGILNGTEFEWVAYTNSDAYFQMKLNFCIPEEEELRMEVVELRCVVFENSSWIGVHNDWIFEDGKVIEKIDTEKVLKSLIQDLEEKSNLKLKIVKVFPFE